MTAINIARTIFNSIKLHPTITAKKQHLQNSVVAENSPVGKPSFISRISSLKFPIIHDIKDNLFGY